MPMSLCRDTLASQPPLPVEQPYYICMNTQGTAAYNAVGISQGTVSLFVSFASFVLIPLVYFILYVSGHVDPLLNSCMCMFVGFA